MTSLSAALTKLETYVSQASENTRVAIADLGNRVSVLETRLLDKLTNKMKEMIGKIDGD